MSVKATRAGLGVPGVGYSRGSARRLIACSRCGIERETGSGTPAEYCRDCKSLLDYEERQARR